MLLPRVQDNKVEADIPPGQLREQIHAHRAFKVAQAGMHAAVLRFISLTIPIVARLLNPDYEGLTPSRISHRSFISNGVVKRTALNVHPCCGIRDEFCVTAREHHRIFYVHDF